ncbi:MAG TPA: glycosyltransferase 87 family protein [Terracidiphilus sp.]|nr:glycosyltransferase 87 family protein [Terracidiphilus sp.]
MRRKDGLRILAVGAALFLLLGLLLCRSSVNHVQDFSGVYYPARCLLFHHDPYNAAQMLKFYEQQTAPNPRNHDDLANLQVVTSQVYLPTTYLLLAPLAVLPWKAAFALWSLVTAGCILLAVYLLWEICSTEAPLLSGLLLALFLVTSATLLAVGNPAGMVIGMCVIAIWCFLRNRHAWLGVLCLGAALALKPHDVGLVWLCLLLFGAAFRRRALQTLAVVVLLCIPSALWISSVSHHWTTELRANLHADGARGDTNDPGPTSVNIGGIDILVNLQTVLSVFRDDPHFYNLATYLICGPLLLAWLVTVLRGRHGEPQLWLALASIAALSMVPLYHRQHDAKLLLLTFPACFLLWTRRGITGWIALGLNAAFVLVNGDIPTLLRVRLIAPWLNSLSGFPKQFLTVVLARPVSLLLLATGIFYLWVYMRAARSNAEFAHITPSSDTMPAQQA